MRFKFYIALASLLLFFSTVKGALAAVINVKETNGFVPFSELNSIFVNVTSIISTLAGFALLINLIRGGIMYITAQGDPKAVTAARATLTWSIIGFVIVIVAFLIISLIGGFVSLPGLGRFCIPQGGGVPYSCPDINTP